MNYKQLPFTILSFVFLFIFNSCNVEPVDPILSSQLVDYNTINNGGGTSGGGTVNQTTIAGTYLLTAFNTSVPTDLNNDGTASSNQLSETSCYNNMLLTLNADHSFIANSKGVDIVSNGTTETMSCFTDPDETGAWSLVGNTLTLTVLGNPTTTETYTVSGNTISATAQNGQVVGYDALTHAPAYLTCNITIVYTKQ
ncbi:MAG: hypothetical protein RIQ59_183 [Bacteroidota bacterium]|jgi:hypothetical protein